MATPTVAATGFAATTPSHAHTLVYRDHAHCGRCRDVHKCSLRKGERERATANSRDIPRIHGELLKLGVDVAESSVSRYMVRCRKPPSQTWRAFLDNHLAQLVSIDFFTVPTIRLHVLYVFLVLAHDRRRILHFNVTAHPTAEWTGQQLREAFPSLTSSRVPRFVTTMQSSVWTSENRCETWASRKCCPRRDRLGSERMWSG